MIINSILSQLDSDDEVIICDDGSTDNTLRIIASLYQFYKSGLIAFQD